MSSPYVNGMEREQDSPESSKLSKDQRDPERLQIDKVATIVEENLSSEESNRPKKAVELPTEIFRSEKMIGGEKVPLNQVSPVYRESLISADHMEGFSSTELVKAPTVKKIPIIKKATLRDIGKSQNPANKGFSSLHSFSPRKMGRTTLRKTTDKINLEGTPKSMARMQAGTPGRQGTMFDLFSNIMQTKKENVGNRNSAIGSHTALNEIIKSQTEEGKPVSKSVLQWTRKSYEYYVDEETQAQYRKNLHDEYLYSEAEINFNIGQYLEFLVYHLVYFLLVGPFINIILLFKRNLVCSTTWSSTEKIQSRSCRHFTG